MKACFVSQRYYPGDGRLQTEITALTEAGWSVDMIAMKQPGERFSEVVEGVRILRIPSLTRQRAGKVRYVAEYITFFTPVFVLLAVMQILRGYRVIHITNLPDTLVFAGLIPKLLGAKIIFDVRECTPEMFMDRFGAQPGSRILNLMTRIEQAALRFAHVSVTCTEQMRQALIQRGANGDQIAVMLNTSELQPPRPITPPPADQVIDGDLRIITHGTVIKRYGHDVLIDALALVVKELPHARLEILGKGQALPDLQAQVARLGLGDVVTFSGFVPDDVLVERLMNAHIGAVTLMQNPEADLVHTFKMYEYLQLAVPMVISATSAVTSYFNDDTMRFFQPGDARSLADAILELARDPALRHRLAVNGLRVYEQCSIPKQRALYRGLVEQVTTTSPLNPLSRGRGDLNSASAVPPLPSKRGLGGEVLPVIQPKDGAS
ncbi:MAG: glycosyltransferase family 4 protein [Chloroflexi bacterium]|nr:glycosyltransferase family 4 protein [Chloroflexota bacterium]